MDHQQILTDEELTMLRELGKDQESAAGQPLSGYLDTPLLGLLQRADMLALEARFAGHQLHFPLYFTQGEDGFLEPRIAAPVIQELSHEHPRAWRLDTKGRLQLSGGNYQVTSLSLNGLIVQQLPSHLKRGDAVSAILILDELAPLALSGVLIREIRNQQTSIGWAINFQMNEADQERLRGWMFQHHQSTFTQAYAPPAK
ncbi:MAG: PilZ domain-containing protein [Aeromonas molluscorum]